MIAEDASRRISSARSLSRQSRRVCVACDGVRCGDVRSRGGAGNRLRHRMALQVVVRAGLQVCTGLLESNGARVVLRRARACVASGACACDAFRLASRRCGVRFAPGCFGVFFLQASMPRGVHSQIASAPFCDEAWRDALSLRNAGGHACCRDGSLHDRLVAACPTHCGAADLWRARMLASRQFLGTSLPPQGWTEVAGMCAAPVTYSGA